MSDTKTRDQHNQSSYEFKVNGVQITTKFRILLARVILDLAKKHGAMPGDPEGYFLQGEKGRYDPDDSVDLAEDSIFITIPNVPTQVAIHPLSVSPTPLLPSPNPPRVRHLSLLSTWQCPRVSKR